VKFVVGILALRTYKEGGEKGMWKGAYTISFVLLLYHIDLVICVGVDSCAYRHMFCKFAPCNHRVALSTIQCSRTAKQMELHRVKDARGEQKSKYVPWTLFL
jgi:hypothetical protein